MLYSSELITTLQSWLVAMSSAQLRSFRHTATVVALEIESALCIVAAAIEKDAETVGRQKEAERKKRKGATNGASEREKTLNMKAAEIKSRKTKMNEFLKDFFDGYGGFVGRQLNPVLTSILYVASSCIVIVMLMRVSALIVSERWVCGCDDTQRISWKAPISVMSAGCYQTRYVSHTLSVLVSAFP